MARRRRIQRAIVELGDEGEIERGICDDPERIEVKPPKFLRRPGQPSKLPRQEHDTHHVDIRSWCRCCVISRQQNRQLQSKRNHNNTKKSKKVEDKEVDGEKGGEEASEGKSDEDSDLLIPMISMDDCFLGAHHTPANKVPSLVIRDEVQVDHGILYWEEGSSGLCRWRYHSRCG